MGCDTLNDVIDDLDKRLVAELAKDARQASHELTEFVN
jgi:DNA-binding Lrp family transcriptional regulator